MNYSEWSKKRLMVAQELRTATHSVRRDYQMPGTELVPSRFTVCVRLRDASVDYSNKGALNVFVADCCDERPTSKNVYDFMGYELEFLAYVQLIVWRWESGVSESLPSERAVVEGFKPHWWDGPLRPAQTWPAGEA